MGPRCEGHAESERQRRPQGTGWWRRRWAGCRFLVLAVWSVRAVQRGGSPGLLRLQVEALAVGSCGGERCSGDPCTGLALRRLQFRGELWQEGRLLPLRGGTSADGAGCEEGCGRFCWADRLPFEAATAPAAGEASPADARRLVHCGAPTSGGGAEAEEGAGERPIGTYVAGLAVWRTRCDAGGRRHVGGQPECRCQTEDRGFGDFGHYVGGVGGSGCRHL